MRKKIHEALGVFKEGGETWQQIIERINKEEGFDLKTAMLLIGIILDTIDKPSGTEGKP